MKCTTGMIQVESVGTGRWWINKIRKMCQIFRIEVAFFRFA